MVESETMPAQAGFNKNRITVLDGWRGLAVLCVLLGHFIPLPGSEIARLGVEMFFLLSGRLMAQILIYSDMTLGRFYWRRFTRVVPALFVFVGIVLILAPIFFSDINFISWKVGSVLSFWSNYYFSFYPREPVFGHTWSLSIEEHSYLLLGLLAVIFSRSAKISLIIIAIVIVACWANGIWQTLYLDRNYYEVYWRTDVRAASLFLGFWGYILLQEFPEMRRRILVGINGYTIAFLICGIGAMFLSIVPDIMKYTIGAFLLMILMWEIEFSKSSQLKSILEHKFLCWLGSISYSVYLYQQIFHASKYDFPFLVWPLFIFISIFTGWLSYLIVEKPSRIFLNNLDKYRVAKEL